eukprot:6473446-Alexandrium_andersonii.AAC.1
MPRDRRSLTVHSGNQPPCGSCAGDPGVVSRGPAARGTGEPRGVGLEAKDVVMCPQGRGAP